MGSCDEADSIIVVELLAHLLPKCISFLSRAWLPSLPIIRVRPKQITKRTLAPHIDPTLQLTNLLNAVAIWAESTMDSEQLLRNHSTEWDEIEHICKPLPDLTVWVFCVSFVVESVLLGDRS
jgi:hypothetical protein